MTRTGWGYAGDIVLLRAEIIGVGALLFSPYPGGGS
jgi:hypothetical protein